MPKLRLYILYEVTEQPWGGSNTFYKNFLAAGRTHARIEIVSSPHRADLILTSGHYQGPGRLLRSSHLSNASFGRWIHHPFGWFKKKGKRKIAFRLDGLRCFYADRMSAADQILLSNFEWADSLIYQSQFSKTCFEKFMGQRELPHSIVFNGADLHLFKPDESKKQCQAPIQLISMSWSTNLKKGFETVAAFSKLENVSISHIGLWPKELASERVKILGAKKASEAAEILRTADFFLFPSQNEACSNAVLEALASGIPVLYHPSGGTPEVCQEGRYALALPDSTEAAVLQGFLEKACQHYPVMRKNILDQRKDFGFERCLEGYLDHFETLLS